MQLQLHTPLVAGNPPQNHEHAVQLWGPTPLWPPKPGARKRKGQSKGAKNEIEGGGGKGCILGGGRSIFPAWPPSSLYPPSSFHGTIQIAWLVQLLQASLSDPMNLDRVALSVSWLITQVNTESIGVQEPFTSHHCSCVQCPVGTACWYSQLQLWNAAALECWNASTCI